MSIIIRSATQYSNTNAMTKLNNLKYYYVINFIFIGLIALINLLGLSSLKYFFITYSIFVFSAILLFPLNQILFIVISFLFFEGQGRILLEYNPIVRILFDSMLALAILRQIIQKKKLINTDRLPVFFIVLFILHSLWYIFEIFNIYNVGFSAPIAASKFYIFPFLLFFSFLNTDFNVEDDHFARLGKTLLVLIMVEVAVSTNQLIQGAPLMNAISAYYKIIMRGVFVGLMFRPFGTTHMPGGISTYLVWSFALLLLPKRSSKIFTFFIWLAILGGGFTIFTTQVRSALIKYALIILTTFVSILLISKNRIKVLILTSLILVSATVAISLTPISDTIITTLNLSASIERAATLKKGKLVKVSRRLDLDNFLNIAQEKLSTHPFGFGPGLPTLGKDLLGNDPIINADAVWSYDNLIIFLIIDFGYGFIFYFLFLVGITVYLGLQTLQCYKKRQYQILKIKLISLSVTVIILIGNWGAVGIPFNPESFFFWLWTTIGITAREIEATPESVT